MRWFYLICFIVFISLVIPCHQVTQVVLLFSFHLIFYLSGLILSGNSILFLRNNGLPSSLNQLSYGNTSYLEDTFYLIGIWSCGYYYKVQGWAHSKHMLSTCTTVYCCALLCAQPFILYYSFLFISLTQPFI